MQLEQLARVVFVEATLRPPSTAERGAARPRANRLKVVEVDEHRGVFRGSQHHVFETPEHVRPDDLTLVTSSERRDQDLGAGGHTEMIGPEGDEPLDERALRGGAGGQRRAAFRSGDFYEPASSLLLVLLASLANRAKRAYGLGNLCRRGSRRDRNQRLISPQLRSQPSSGIVDALALADARAKTKSVEGTKRGIHDDLTDGGSWTSRPALLRRSRRTAGAWRVRRTGPATYVGRVLL